MDNGGGSYNADINAPEAWSLFQGSPSINIGILDDGVVLNHPDINGKASGDPSIGEYHGTFIAGICAAYHNSIGIKGIDRNAKIISKRTHGSSISDIANKIINASETCQVLNSSWYLNYSYNDIITIRHAYIYAYYVKNRISVCAVGNDNTEEVKFPAGFGQGIIAVGSSTDNDVRSSFSNKGWHLDVVAPGGTYISPPFTSHEIFSIYGNNSYAYDCGTSFSTAIVSGISSLLLGYADSKNISLYSDDVEHIIQLGTKDLYPPGKDKYTGYGRVDAHKTLNYLNSPYTLNDNSTNGGTVWGSSDWFNMYILGGGFYYYYCVKRYEVRQTVTFPAHLNNHVWGIGIGTTGWSVEKPNYAMGWCDVVPGTVTQNSATLRTYVYKVKHFTCDGEFEWHPCSPENVVYHYRVLSGEPSIQPVISNITQSPPMICAGRSGVVRCNLLQGNGNIKYYWRWINKPTNIIVDTYGYSNYITIRNNYADNSASSNTDNSRVGDPFIIYCKAENGGPFSQEKQLLVQWDRNPCGGCPWLLVKVDSNKMELDNNILHRAELPEYAGQDITDFYKLRTTPFIADDGLVSINFFEGENDYTYFNQIKLYAVDHPNNTKIDITENNDIIMYDSSQVLAIDEAYLNGEDIADKVNYHYPIGPEEDPVEGDTLDHINSVFMPNPLENAAIIAEIEGDAFISPIINKDNNYYFVSAQEGDFNGYFSQRERSSVVVIPFTDVGELNINSVDIDWYRNYNIKYIALASVQEDGFTVNELPLVQAINSVTGDALPFIQSIDTLYAELDTGATLTAKFNNNTSEYELRDYVLEINGRYIKSGQSFSDNLIFNNFRQNEQPSKFKLYNNYPNPFNPKTTIKYDISKAGLVKVKVYDLLGRLIKTLVNEYKTPGRYSTIFDGSNLASGIYIYRLETGSFADVKKMVFIK